jgi:hypothetical protein
MALERSCMVWQLRRKGASPIESGLGLRTDEHYAFQLEIS